MSCLCTEFRHRPPDMVVYWTFQWAAIACNYFLAYGRVWLGRASEKEFSLLKCDRWSKNNGNFRSTHDPGRVWVEVISKLRSSSSKSTMTWGLVMIWISQLSRECLPTPFSSDVSLLLIEIKRRKTNSGAAIRSVRGKKQLCMSVTLLRNYFMAHEYIYGLI